MAMTRANAPRPGRYITFRLHELDRQLLKDLGRLRPGVEDRHAALLELTGIVNELELENVRGRERRPLRIRIPEELEQAINRKVEATGGTFLGVLLEAAREYQRRHRHRSERRPQR
jgi:hypothetical protein